MLEEAILYHTLPFSSFEMFVMLLILSGLDKERGAKGNDEE